MQQRLVLAYGIIVIELISQIHWIASQAVCAILYRRKVLPNIIIIPVVAQIWILGYVETLAMIILCGLLMGIRISFINTVVIVLAHRHQFTIIVLLIFTVVLVTYVVLMLQQIRTSHKIITFLFGIIFADNIRVMVVFFVDIGELLIEFNRLLVDLRQLLMMRLILIVRAALCDGLTTR